eukprot:Gb_37589 [translate_table: standard]
MVSDDHDGGHEVSSHEQSSRDKNKYFLCMERNKFEKLQSSGNSDCMDQNNEQNYGSEVLKGHHGYHHFMVDNSSSGLGRLKMNKESQKIRKPALMNSISSVQQPVAANMSSGAQYRKPVIIHTYSPKIIQAEAHNFMQLVQKLTGWDDNGGDDDDECRHGQKNKKKKRKKNLNSSTDPSGGSSNCIVGMDSNSTNSSATNPILGSPNKSSRMPISYMVSGRSSEMPSLVQGDDESVLEALRNSTTAGMMNNIVSEHDRNPRNHISSVPVGATHVNPVSSRSNYGNPSHQNFHHLQAAHMGSSLPASNPCMIMAHDNPVFNNSGFGSSQPTMFPHNLHSTVQGFVSNIHQGLAVDLPILSHIHAPNMSSDTLLFPCKQTNFQAPRSEHHHHHQNMQFLNPNSHDHLRFLENLPSSSSLGITEGKRFITACMVHFCMIHLIMVSFH